MLDFKTEVYPLILKKLAEKRRYFTKTENEPNFVKLDGDTVMVRTIKSKPNYEKIPYEFFEKTWDILKSKGKIIFAVLILILLRNIKTFYFFVNVAIPIFLPSITDDEQCK